MGQTQIAHHHGVMRHMGHQLGGVMSNVIELHPHMCPCCVKKNWKKDIDEYCEGYKNGEPFSQNKDHFGYLICGIIKNESIPIDLRREAGYVLYKYSDYRHALDSIFLERQNPTEIKEK